METPKENYRHALDASNNALRVFTLEKNPFNYARVQYNRGVLLQALAEAERNAQFARDAITALREVRRVRTKQDYPIEYATISLAIASAYLRLFEANGDARDIEHTISAATEAVASLPAKHPNAPIAELLLGDAFTQRGVARKQTSDFDTAIAHYERCLTALQGQERSFNYANAVQLLGTTYLRMCEAGNRDAASKATERFKQALRIAQEQEFQPVIDEVRPKLATAAKCGSRR